MRSPILLMLSVIVASPVMAAPQSAVPLTVTAPAVALPLAVESPKIATADNAPAIFSETTDPVPLLPSQRKLLRLRKV